MSHGERPLGPAVAGTWYPADRGHLQSLVGRLLDEAAAAPAPPDAGARARALIAPHAGFAYSGRVAASAFAGLRGARFDRVLLVGPSHYAAFEGAVVPAAAACYRTPLGDVPLDREAIHALSARRAIGTDDAPFRPEHCLEAELPFLQQALEPGWRLVPVLVGALGPARAESLARELEVALDGETLVVVSSDFTHYGPRFDYVPFHDDVPRRIEELDRGAVERILAGDAAGFEAYLARTGATICGRHPIRLLLRLLPAGSPGRLAGYDTSGHITGAWDHSVSYASLVFGASGPLPCAG
jgi:AmmeMemoRadiSam system protein B